MPEATSTPPSRVSSRPARLDDERVAARYARTAAEIKGRGRLRVMRELQAMGIAKAIAAEALGESSATRTSAPLVARALQKKLRAPRRTPARRRRKRASLSVPDAPGLHARRHRGSLRKLRGAPATPTTK